MDVVARSLILEDQARTLDHRAGAACTQADPDSLGVLQLKCHPVLRDCHRDRWQDHRRFDVVLSRPAEAVVYGLLLPHSILTWALYCSVDFVIPVAPIDRA